MSLCERKKTVYSKQHAKFKVNGKKRGLLYIQQLRNLGLAGLHHTLFFIILPLERCEESGYANEWIHV